jgi:tripartite-type tricarboxylate transporter receptor subunit TctC
MYKRLVALSTILTLLVTGVGSLHAQSFFDGKTIRVVVGFAPGGGFDTYARVIARHMGRHIPGSPTIVVENMTGAGSLIAANHLYRVAKPDGLTIGHFNGALFLGQVLGQPGIDFDARKFELIGAPIREDAVCALTKASGIPSVEKWMAAKTPVKLGVSRPAAARRQRESQGGARPSIQLVRAKGHREIRLAASSASSPGRWSWESCARRGGAGLDTEVVAVLQTSPRGFRTAGRPLASLAKSDEARQLIKVGIQNTAAFARPFALPPGTPKDRLLALRRAFQETLKDPAFLAESEKAKLTLDPATAEELDRMVAEAFALEPALVAKLKDILYK